MKKETMYMLGAGVLGFLAVRYYLKKRNESTSSIVGQKGVKKTYSSACGCGA